MDAPMAFVRAVPKDVKELSENLKKLFENRGHVDKVEVNPKTNHLEVTLDTAAHWFGTQDFFIPIKKDKVDAAKKLVDAMWKAIKDKKPTPPTEDQAKELFGYIDPAGK
jgi:hypothetical protein